MYSSDIEYMQTNRFSMSLLDYFGSSLIAMKLQIPHAENADALRALLNKYSIVHWSLTEDSDTHTVFRSNLSEPLHVLRHIASTAHLGEQFNSLYIRLRLSKTYEPTSK